jgi:glycosyl transferase family 25
MKIYAINLPKCQERRANIEKECARYSLEMEIVPAVDGGKLTPEELRELVFEPGDNPLTLCEIGCALSHLKIYRKMVSDSVPVALVLEDDSRFLADPRPVLAGLEQENPGLPEAWLLTKTPRDNKCDQRRFREIAGHKFYKLLNAAGNYGYAVSLKAAENLCEFLLPIRMVADSWKYFLVNGVLRAWACDAAVIGMEESLAAASEIEGERAKSVGSAQRRRHEKRLRRMTPWDKRLRYYAGKIFRGALSGIDRLRYD